ncbi:hypothetical protein KJ966_24725 [bacterium]|nr:hypothetical protein [bacterium]
MKASKPKFFKYLSSDDYRAITFIMHQVMKPVGASAIATNMDTDYQDMMNRINDNQVRSPRKLELVIRIMDESGNPEPFLNWLCSRYNHIAIPLPPVELTQDSLFELMTKVAKEMGDISRELLEATEDNIIRQGEYMRLQKEIMDLVKVSLVLDLALGQVVQG